MAGTVRHKHRHGLAIAAESTAGIAPADGTAWAAVQPIVITKLDVSGVKTSAWIDDPRLETYGQAVNTSNVLEGARNAEIKFSTDLYGLGESPAVDAQAVATPMTTMVEKALGGGLLTYTTTFTGGSATAPIVDDVTGIVAGSLLFAQDITSPNLTNTGRVYCCQVKSVDAGTKVVELTEALPFTPAATDPVFGGFTGYIKETTVESAVAALHTVSILAQLGFTDPDDVYQLMGAALSFGISGLEKNQAPQMDWTAMSGYYKHADVDGLVNVTHDDPPFGYPPLAVHSLRCSIASTATTARGDTSVASFACELGTMHDPVEVITDQNVYMQGRHDYTVKFENSTITIVVPTYDAAWLSALRAGTRYRITLTQGSKGAGKVWALHFPNCQLTENPGRSDVGEAMGVQLSFRAGINESVPESDDDDLRLSRCLIGFA